MTTPSTGLQQDSPPLGVSILALLSIVVGIFSIWMGVNSALIILVSIGLLLNISIIMIDWESIHRYILAILVRIVLIAYLLQPEIKNRFK